MQTGSMETRAICSRPAGFWLDAQPLLASCQAKHWLFGMLVALAAARGLAKERPLSLAPLPPLTAVIGRAFNQQLEASGGVASYNWRVAEGSDPLPPGLQLDPKSGLISGMPLTAGSFSFKVAVTDSAGPPSTEIKSFIIDVPSALMLDWLQPPHALKEGHTVALVVSNQTRHSVDLKVIIV